MWAEPGHRGQRHRDNRCNVVSRFTMYDMMSLQTEGLASSVEAYEVKSPELLIPGSMSVVLYKHL